METVGQCRLWGIEGGKQRMLTKGNAGCFRSGEGHKERRAESKLQKASQVGAVGTEGSRSGTGKGDGTDSRGAPGAAAEEGGSTSASSSEGGRSAVESSKSTEGESKGATENVHA